MSPRNHYVYMLRCKDNTLYTGYTTDPKRRLSMHETGKGARYTKGRGPFVLEHVECFGTKGEALSREHAIKALSRRQKEALIEAGKSTEKRDQR